MAPKAERIKVEVTDSTEGEMRTFKITLKAPNSDFQLADLLRHRGVMPLLDGELKQAIRVATQNYLSSAERLISTLTKVSMATPKVPNNKRGKDRNTTRIGASVGSASELQQESTAGRN